MTDEDEQVGALMRRWREAAGLSQADAASDAGMTQSQWSRVESGRRTLKWREGLAFALALGVDPEALTVDPMQLLGEAFGPNYGPGHPARQPLGADDDRPERHARHARTCWCLNDSATCCDPTCCQPDLDGASDDE